MTVNTTFLPKTNGLTFGDRLVARADKGRVFLLTAAGDEIVEPPPSLEPITVTVDGDDYNYDVGDPVPVTKGQRVVCAVVSGGDASPSYDWTTRSGQALIESPIEATTNIDIQSDPNTFISCRCRITDYDSLEDEIIVAINFLVVQN